VAILTVCNTVAGHGGHGYGLPVVRALAAHGPVKVFAARPALVQGARLTMTGTDARRLDCALITDGMAASIMRIRSHQPVLVAQTAIEANGDAANKNGTWAGRAGAVRRHTLRHCGSAHHAGPRLAQREHNDSSTRRRRGTRFGAAALRGRMRRAQACVDSDPRLAHLD
jgi:hypothetical protein